jgi:hypothetical protein
LYEVIKILSGNLEESQDATKFGNVNWRDKVLQGVEVLLGKFGSGLVALEAKELSGRETYTGFVCVKGDIIFQTHLEKLFKVVHQVINVIVAPQPIINVVGDVGGGLSGLPMWSLRFGPAVLLPKR